MEYLFPLAFIALLLSVHFYHILDDRRRVESGELSDR